jgi:GAF domain-containing protein
VALSLAADWVQVLTIDEGREQIIDAAEAGPRISRMKSPHVKPSFEDLYRGQSGRAMREHAAVVVSNGHPEPHTEIDAYWLPDINDVGALMVVPVYYRDKALGAIITTNRIGQPAFSQDDVEFLENLTNQMASILENRVLLEKMQGTLAELEATQRRYTVQAWESYLTQFETRRYERSLENDDSSLALMPSERESLHDKKRSLVLTDRTTHSDAESGDQPSESKASKLLVPLKIRDEVIGVLGLQEADATRHWTPEEIALVEAVAEQMAQAAENLRLLDETQRRAAREQRVNEIGAKIRAAHSLEEALQIAVREVGLSLSAPQTSVQLDVE